VADLRGARGALAPLPPGTPWSPLEPPRIFCAINGERGCSGLQELEEEEASAPLYFIPGSAPGCVSAGLISWRGSITEPKSI